jgi:PPP family 3-phenylpropionic acid transporter
MIVSISTVFILAAQFFWGMASDRAKIKNHILLFLYLGAAVASLLFYVGSGFYFFLVMVTLFSVFFNPIMPLQDNIMLESFEGGHWDYGQIRMGGTIGYCITVLSIGFILQNQYSRIFWMASLILVLCFFVARKLKPVEGYRNESRKTSFREVLKNKPLLGMIFFNLTFFLGLNFFYNFYPIYYTSIGGSSSYIGAMMFACALTEIPSLLIVNRLVRRFGIGKLLVMAGFVTSLRWFLLFFLMNPYLIIMANLLHGAGYTAFTYCIITYINKTVPKDLRATSQSANAMIGSVISRIVFGYAGGLASEIIGTNYMMLFAGIVMVLSTMVFAVWSKTQREIFAPQKD